MAGEPNPNTTFPPDAPVYPTQPVTVILPDPAALKPIHTEHLILSPLNLDSEEAVNSDAAGFFRFRSKPDVSTWLRFKTPDTSLEQTKSWMNAKLFSTPDASGAVNSRHFFFSIVLKSEPGTFIGGVGINSLYPAPSVGYALHPDFWGRGYATEALRGVIEAWWALPRATFEDGNENETVSTSGEEKVFAATQRENIGSFKVLSKVGFEVYEFTEYEGKNIAFMSLGRKNLYYHGHNID